jgi:hypothetical protein
MTKTILLDGNIYNRLNNDPATVLKLRDSVKVGRLRVIATPIVVQELTGSPFGGLPDWFPIEVQDESVCVLGFALVGAARLGDAQVFTKHLGNSRKTADAIIADSADTFADVFVSDDDRCRRRVASFSSRCVALDYQEFMEWLGSNDA